MTEYSFLPMNINQNSLEISEPFGSKVAKELPKQIISVGKDNVSVYIKNVKEKKEFIDKIENSIKKAQREMMDNFLYKKSPHYL